MAASRTSRFAAAKADLLAAAASSVPDGGADLGPQTTVTLTEVLSHYYRYVSYEDLVGREPHDIAGPVLHHLRDALVRQHDDAVVSVFAPEVEHLGWSSHHSVVHVVAQDMPFLVDSITAQIVRAGYAIHLVVHPIFGVERDAEGELGAITVGRSHEAAHHEAWIHVEIDRETDAAQLQQLADGIRMVLRDVRRAVDDWPKMLAQAERIAQELENTPPAIEPPEVAEASAMLRWLAADNFTFLGYREYALSGDDEDLQLRAVDGSGLGILRDNSGSSLTFSTLPAEVRRLALEPQLLVLTKANSRSTVHRSAYLDYVGVKVIDNRGKVIGERRFLGLFTAGAYNQSVRAIPYLSAKLDALLDAAGLSTASHSGREMVQFVETYPRDELFSISVSELLDVALQVANIQERRQVRVFVRPDDYARFVSVLVYLPRDRYSTSVRHAIERELIASFLGETIDYTARVSESVLARLHFIVRVPKGQRLPDIDVEDLELRVEHATRSWDDDLVDHLVDAFGEQRAAHLAKLYDRAFPESYKQDFDARAAVVDLGHIDSLVAPGDLALSLYEPFGAGAGQRRFKVLSAEQAISLSVALPILARLGAEVVDERPYCVQRHDGMDIWIHDFGFSLPADQPSVSADLDARFQDAFRAVWSGRAESDGFNALVLVAGITWREAAILRTYARYLRQTGTTYSQEYIEQAVSAQSTIATDLVQLFHARFDPSQHLDRARAQEEIEHRIVTALDLVPSLDFDRIIRTMLALIKATERTNWYQRNAEGHHREHLSIKLDPARVVGLPLPLPHHEIWVCSPRVEGVHLRFGSVARGGLRWSDRREDFRTEILGLVKAQTVKNAVIVPTGAKGGFVVKQPPPESDGKQAMAREALACYTSFVEGLLDITDNRVGAEVVPPADVVRHDEDDSYLVVAADKGTASFSDTANAIALRYGFWLGDAFASGGSEGYDHKAMGITARGAWESVKAHFRLRGVDTTQKDFTVVGIGDMSGDVFGNAMLLSPHVRLVAAFDHRHVFIDPTPDAERSFVERQRLFALSGSSWADYDASLISDGGGVFPRTAKSVTITAPMRHALGMAESVTQMTPAELIRALLQAPVDLLFNGGIGTYVKARTESHLQVGDKANDALRIDGEQLRCAVVAEGGNLGMTQAGRIEAARSGVLLNTDAIDNSAGVDTSDHEVNIKILLDAAVRDSDLTAKQRHDLLHAVTDEVATMVLRDNIRQNQLLQISSAQAGLMIGVHRRLVAHWEETLHLDRVVEGLPDDMGFAELAAGGMGLTTPELSVLSAHAKISLTRELLATSVPDEAWSGDWLAAYFPETMRQRFSDRLARHALHREIVAMAVANDMVNRGGISFEFRAREETSADAAALARAAVVAIGVFGLNELWQQLADSADEVPMDAQLAMHLDIRRLLDRATRWFLQNRSVQIDVTAEVQRFAPIVSELAEVTADLIKGGEYARYRARADELIALGAPSPLAEQVAILLDLFAALDIAQVAEATGTPVLTSAQVYFDVADSYGIDELLTRVTGLSRDDHWEATARFALRSDVYTALAGLTQRVLSSTDASLLAHQRIEAWEASAAEAIERTRTALAEVAASADHDDHEVSPITVALRVLRNLVWSS